ncbi:MAG: HAD hydrolase family protein [Akkermansiaceae bacterium]|nr:HAD hydrolase family protein [Akkermansiaceae bacterium]
MQFLKPLDSPKRLLSFDFDGTLHDPGGEPPVPEELFERILILRKSHGAAWGVNTGRSLDHLLEGLADSGFPFLPDWAVTREREIHFPAADGWRSHQEWNDRCARDIEELFDCNQLLLGRIRREMEEQTGARWLTMDGEPAGVIAQTEEEIDWIIDRVKEYVDANSDLNWQRNSIYLRFGHRRYNKGSSLSEVGRLLGVKAADCFAIGDSHNDLEMLDGTHAAMVACPANSIDEIRDLVERSGGLVCKKAHGDAILEAFDHFFAK